MEARAKPVALGLLILSANTGSRSKIRKKRKLICCRVFIQFSENSIKSRDESKWGKKKLMR